MRTAVIGLMSILSVLIPSSSSGQQFAVMIAGVPVSCTANNGQPVPIFTNPAAAQAARPLGGARADFSPQNGFTIALDPVFMTQLSPLAAFFVMYHECAHVALPFGVGLLTPAQERNADCAAIREMRRHNLVTNWDQFNAATSPIVGGNTGHGFDQARLMALAQCASW